MHIQNTKNTSRERDLSDLMAHCGFLSSRITFLGSCVGKYQKLASKRGPPVYFNGHRLSKYN